MTTLTGDELFEYLTHLEKEIEKLSTSPTGNLRALMYSQMQDLIASEKKFLQYINSNGTKPVLSISPNGLPSIASLNPDLEKMCELEEPEFENIAQRYQKGIDTNKKDFYVSVSEEKWQRELKKQKPEIIKTGFAINETEEGKFELTLREESYLKGYDKYSKEYPVLIRQGRMQYHVVWNRLIEDSRETFYVPNTALALSGKPTKPHKEIFDDLRYIYYFKKRNFQLVRKPFLWWTRQVLPKKTQYLLAASTDSRINFTERILDTLTEILEKTINLEKVNRKDLPETLSFSHLIINNSPCSGYHSRKEIPLVTDSKNPIGTISYSLPYRDFNGVHKGCIRLSILGDIIEDYQQCLELKKIFFKLRI